MITPKTKAAIAILDDIYWGAGAIRTKKCNLSEEEKRILLAKLTSAGLINLDNKEKPYNTTSYKPTKNAINISLLDILRAIDEHLNCNEPITEDFYMKHGKAARKLGVINQLTRKYLQEIKLYEL